MKAGHVLAIVFVTWASTVLVMISLAVIGQPIFQALIAGIAFGVIIGLMLNNEKEKDR